MEHQLSRRGFFIAAGMLTTALVACQTETQKTPIPDQAKPQPTSEVPPQKAIEVKPASQVVPPQSESAQEIDTDAEIFRQFTPEISKQLEILSRFDTNFVFFPLDRPQNKIDRGGDVIIPSASLIKVPLVICALEANPRTSLEPGSDAYCAIVNSVNSAAARIIKELGSFDDINNLLHFYFKFPTKLGLTQWGYPPTVGWSTSVVTDLKPGTPLCSEGFSNPYTLNSALSIYQFLENRDFVMPQKDRFKQVLGIPAPEYPTPLDHALDRARQRHPGIKISYYGKNGTLTPNDWGLNKYFLSEAVILTVNSRPFSFAYSTQTFNLDKLLDTTLDLAASLSQNNP